MTKKHFSKALALLAAVCITAGCDGGAAKETTTSAGTTAITSIEGNLNEKEYCEIPDGMTFEDLCGMLCVNEKKVVLPCTIDDFLCLDSRFYTDDLLDGSSASIQCEIDKKHYLIIFGTTTKGNMQSVNDISDTCLIGLSSFFSSNCFSINNDIKYGDSAAEVFDMFGLPYETFEGGCYYLFEDNNIVLRIEFAWDNNYLLSDFSIARIKEELL